MEDSKEKKQNNRREDEKRNPDSKDNTASKEKEWDPNTDAKDEEVADNEKLIALKNIRRPHNDENA